MCSVPVKPIVAFDVDGTMSEYHYSLAKHAWNYHGVPHRSDWWDGSGNYEDWLGITQAQYREAKLAFRQGGYKRWVPPMPGLEVLCDVVRRLRNAGKVEVWITTTRPWNRLDSVDPDTRFWLDRHFPVYDHILYDEHKYRHLATIVDPERVVLVADDLPEMVHEAGEAFGTNGWMPVLMERPHNQAYRRSIEAALWPMYTPCQTLGVLAGIVEARVETWHEEEIHRDI